jgi:uncharacterized protein
MQDGHFEWDDRKAAGNLAKHDVSFEFAKLVYDDPLAEEWQDGDPDEERTITVGQAHGVLLIVISTERNGRTRIIPA